MDGQFLLNMAVICEQTKAKGKMAFSDKSVVGMP